MSETKWLSPEEREAWLGLISVMFKTPGTIERQLVEDSSLSFAEYLVLAILSEAPERKRRMSDLATATYTAQSRLSRIVTRLEDRGLVERYGDGGDKRVVVAVLTDAGVRCVEQAAPAHVAHVRKVIFDKLTPEQVGHLATICRTLLEAGGSGASEAEVTDAT
ncbi:MarR family winged helix-turn-helix transcriptional regulator [Kocuria sp.]|uniref:MarR family winged helix-turn-helix transcriptional regulator n=1 Tax=Kocuria sp. TaxID=1871328 RepID=UPI0026DF89DE|nr:MarR family winged helix-turn-helix transcriptional regulator [Kocuria sp.]MDO5619037.1 MarR family winged helix-turn-helix transcriptional regulator [Kocuria sp.]